LNSLKVEHAESQGNIVRDCPGTKDHICCGYKTIDLIEGCALSCSYCILKAYLSTPAITIHDDIPYITSQIDDMTGRETRHILRFGTGELSDSLALDRRYKLNRPLVEFFGERKNALLELKSKWAYIDHLIPHLNPYTIISFSIAPQRIIDEEEKRTSPLYKRLKTARKAQDAGCFVGLQYSRHGQDHLAQPGASPLPAKTSQPLHGAQPEKSSLRRIHQGRGWKDEIHQAAEDQGLHNALQDAEKEKQRAFHIFLHGAGGRVAQGHGNDGQG